jgi:hypothetical protein
MNTRICYQKIFLDPPLKDARINASEILPDHEVEARMGTLAALTPDNPYQPADRLHGLRYFVNSIRLENAP